MNGVSPGEATLGDPPGTRQQAAVLCGLYFSSSFQAPAMTSLHDGQVIFSSPSFFWSHNIKQTKTHPKPVDLSFVLFLLFWFVCLFEKESH